MSVVLYTGGPTNASGYMTSTPKVESKRVGSAQTPDKADTYRQSLPRLLAGNSSSQAPIPFRAQLRVWAEAENVDKLARFVLRDKSIPSPVKDEQIAQKVREAIQAFLRDNGQKFNRGDLWNLKKLKRLVLTLEETTSRRERVAGYNPTDLEKVIVNLARTISIHCAMLKAPDMHIQHIAGYLKPSDSVQMYFAGMMSKPILADYFKKLNSSAGSEKLVSGLFNRFADKLEKGSQIDEVSEIIDIFFSNASNEMQNSFFKEMAGLLEEAAEKQLKDLFFEFVIRSLPTSMQSLNLFPLGVYIRDEHVRIIVNRMIYLQSLSLKGCIELTDEAVAWIAESPNMAKLEDLDLGACLRLTDKAPRLIAKSPNLPHLQRLRLDMCNRLTDKAVGMIPKSPRRAHLRQLSFAKCNEPTDAAISTIGELRRWADSRYLNNGLTDAVPADIARRRAHTANVDYLYFEGPYCGS